MSYTTYKRHKVEITEDYIVFATADEYPGTAIAEKWIIASDLSFRQLLAKHGEKIKRYTPFIPVSMEIGNAIIESHRAEDAQNKASLRHNTSLESYKYEGRDFGQEDMNLTRLMDDSDVERLNKLLSKLSRKQAALVQAIFLNGVPRKEYARMTGVSNGAISHQIETIKKRLKEFI